MKKLAMSVLFVTLLVGSAAAHNGALSLYTNQSITRCDTLIGGLQTVTINMYYVKDLGVNLGDAVEFRLITSDPRAIFTNEVWNPGFTLSLGSVDSGISLSGPNCVGGPANVTLIGAIDVFWADFTPPIPTFTISVVADPGGNPPGIYITQCIVNVWPIIPVLGGTFVFNGSCNPGVQPKTWGAIKDLYR